MSNARNLSRLPQLGAGNASIMKNRIINGAMVIDQRNAGASITANDYSFGVDRWSYYAYQNGKGTIQQNQGSVTPPAGFVNYLGFTSNSAYSVPAGEAFFFNQRIEGYNIADLGWGTANAKTVTLSFWVYSSLTGTFGGAIRNSAGTRSYPYSYSVSSANTWTQVNVTIAGDTSGTWLTTNGIGAYVTFGLGVGSTFSGTAGSWAGANYWSATGATSVVGTNGATFYITGVQLEVGSSATGYEYRQYGQELALCQRYYETSITGVAVANQVTAPSRMVATSFTNQSLNQNISFKVTKRAVPTITTYTAAGLPGTGFFDVYIGGVWVAGTTNGITAYFNSFDLDFNIASSTTPNNSYITAGNWAASAEL